MLSYLKKIYNSYEVFILSGAVLSINLYSPCKIINLFSNLAYWAYIGYNFNQYLNLFIEYKIILSNKIITYLYGKDFYLCKCYLYTDVDTKIDVTNFFKYFFTGNIIKRELIDKLYRIYNVEFQNNEHIRLKFMYYFNSNKYISYYPYYKINIFNDESMLLDKNYYLPYPFFNNKIMDNYRKNIIYPNYLTLFLEEHLLSNIPANNKLYNLFNIESKNIMTLTVNHIFNKQLVEYFKMIKTPFNDYGILYNCPIRLIWILTENDIDISEFKDFFIKFWEQIFDEKKMELKEHFINLKNLNSIIISEHMKEILSK